MRRELPLVLRGQSFSKKGSPLGSKPPVAEQGQLRVFHDEPSNNILQTDNCEIKKQFICEVCKIAIFTCSVHWVYNANVCCKKYFLAILSTFSVLETRIMSRMKIFF